MDGRLSLDVVYQDVVGVVEDGRVGVVEAHVRSLGGRRRRRSRHRGRRRCRSCRRSLVLVLGSRLFLLLVAFVVQGLDLVEERLGPEVASVGLLELVVLVVQGLEVVALVLVPPHLVEVLLDLSPLLVFRSKPGCKNEWGLKR